MKTDGVISERDCVECEKPFMVTVDAPEQECCSFRCFYRANGANPFDYADLRAEWEGGAQ